MTNDPKAGSRQQAPAEKPQPTTVHRELSLLVGEWRTEGELVAPPGEAKRGAPARLYATDSYEWLPGEFFLLHRAAGELAGERVDALEVFGYDAERQRYFSYAFDNQGTVKQYAATLDGRRWRIDGETERFRGEFGADGQTLTGLWELREDTGPWAPWLRIDLRKVR